MGRDTHARVAIVAVFLLSAAALWLAHERTRPRYSLAPAAVIAAARADPTDHAFLARNPATAARVIPLDGELQRVTFFDGPRVVLDAVVDEHGEVSAREPHVAGEPASGAALANSPWILALLSVVFGLATMVTPLSRVRNLDALVLASLTVTVVLINDRLVGASVIWAWSALAYLLLRCAAIGLRGSRAPAAPSAPLLTRLLAGWEPRARLRMLRLLVAATALAFAIITLTSSGFTDVAAASLQGATELAHGVLPYGHITLALHGDTYPLGNYVLYIPGALWLPVTDSFSDLSGSLPTTALASLLVGVALYRIAASVENPAEEQRTRVEARLRPVLAWLAFPPVLLAASGAPTTCSWPPAWRGRSRCAAKRAPRCWRSRSRPGSSSCR